MSFLDKLPRRQYLFLMSASAARLLMGGLRDRAIARSTCRKARVTILKVSVSKSESYGIFGEPGTSTEWDLIFTVAGQQIRKRIDGVRDGSELAIDEPFVVNLNSIQEILEVSVSGVEIDDSSANDPLPTAKYKVVPKDNWVEGQTLEASAANDDFSYTFSFKIECAEETSSSALTAGLPSTVRLKCLGDIEGSRWLDGRTGDATVGLAPDTTGYSGTNWEVYPG